MIFLKKRYFINLLFFCEFSHALVFVNGKSQPLKEYQHFTKKLERVFKGDCPAIIKVRHSSENVSKFDPRNNSIIINLKKSDRRYEKILVHEAVHMCLFKKTSGHNIIEEFKFIDEGYADIISERILNRGKSHKNRSLIEARVKSLFKPLKFNDVKNWKEYFGRPPNINFKAYFVGANFIYFIEDTYGMNTVSRILDNMKSTKQLKGLLEKTFKRPVVSIEKEWNNYLIERQLM